MRVIPQPGQPLHSLTIIVLLRDDVAMGNVLSRTAFAAALWSLESKVINRVSFLGVILLKGMP